jgi:hypothetical protein
MDDFVIPTEAPNSYTLYSNYLNDYSILTVQQKEVHYAPKLPVQEVRMWETFARVCRGLHDGEQLTSHTSDGHCWIGDPSCVREAQSLAKQSHDSQLIMDALLKSIAQGGAKINFDT